MTDTCELLYISVAHLSYPWSQPAMKFGLHYSGFLNNILIIFDRPYCRLNSRIFFLKRKKYPTSTDRGALITDSVSSPANHSLSLYLALNRNIMQKQLCYKMAAFVTSIVESQMSSFIQRSLTFLLFILINKKRKYKEETQKYQGSVALTTKANHLD